MAELSLGIKNRKGKKSNRRAVVFLLIFALPFAGGGTFVGYLAGSMLVDWVQAQSWDEVPARILSTDLDVNHGDDSTTYKVSAVYEYSYMGESFTSDVVSFGFGSDNIGSFHQDKHAELRAYVASGERFRCFVNPSDPSEAVLYRELRWGLLGLQVVFALVFALVGYGLMFAAVYGSRLVKEAEKLKESQPEQPWLWEKEWAAGRIQAGSKGKMIGALIFATLWNLISAPVLFFVPGEVADGNNLALIALIFPAVGALLATWAVYAVLQWRKFGNSTFEMHSNPGVLGGYLEGRIHTNIRTRPEGGYRLTLNCTRLETSGSGKNRSSTTRVLWQDTVVLPGNHVLAGPHGAAIPVRFGIPYDAGPETDPEGSETIKWQLEVAAELPGVDFSTHFDVPVFLTEESDPDLEIEPEDPIGSSGRDPVIELRAAGIVREPLPDGGVSYLFTRARSKGAALGLTFFTIIWCGFIWLMISLGAPRLFPIVFGLFAALFVVSLFEMWLKETRVEIDGGTLTFTKRWISSGKKIIFDAADISSIKPKRGMQANSKLYYRIELQTRAGKGHILATQLTDQRLAKRLIREFEEALAG